MDRYIAPGCFHDLPVSDQSGGSQSVHQRGYTKVQYLDRLEESVLAAEVLRGPLGTMIFNVWKTAGSKYVIIATAHRPIEVGHSPLIVHDVRILYKVRGPRRFVRLQQVAR